MYDTIYIWLPAERAGEIDLNLFVQNLSGKEEIKDEFGSLRIRGKLRNLHVLLTETGISIKGSLPKFYQGHNLKNLNFEEIKLAIQKIGNDLSIPILSARLTRIDIGFNISMEHEPKYYFPGLGEISKMHRSNIEENSLYYRNSSKSKTLNFYDKNREFYKTSNIPSKFGLGKNLLRYELRLEKWLGRNFEGREILVSDLIDKRFCYKIVTVWADHYFSINKNNIVQFDLKLIDSAKEYLEFLLLKGIEFHKTNISADIKFLKSVGAFKSKEYYSRLISKINEISTNPKFSTVSVFNEELDSKIEMILAKWDSG